MALSCARAEGAYALRVVGTCDGAEAPQALMWWGKTPPWLKLKLEAFRTGLVPALGPFSFHLKHRAGPWL